MYSLSKSQHNVLKNFVKIRISFSFVVDGFKFIYFFLFSKCKIMNFHCINIDFLLDQGFCGNKNKKKYEMYLGDYLCDREKRKKKERNLI